MRPTVGWLPAAADDLLELVDGDGNLAVAEQPAPAVGHEQIVLDAHTAEIAVGFEPLEVDDTPVEPLGAALVDERGDEVEPGLVGHDGAGAELPSGAVDAGARGGGTPGDVREVERPLAHGLAIVDVEPEPVAEPVGHEEGHGPGGDGVLGRTFDEPGGPQTLGQREVGGVYTSHSPRDYCESRLASCG